MEHLRYRELQKYNKKGLFKDPYLNEMLKKARGKNIMVGAKPKLQSKIQRYAINNRKRGIKPELKVYHLIRAFFDFKVYRQNVIGFYIVDLLIPEKNLIIEIDGEYHEDEEQQKKDKKREDYLRSKGYEILRFKNKEVEENLLNILSVLEEKFAEKKDKLTEEYQTMVI